MAYTRYRFKTKSVNDPRPLQSLKPIQCPYWITGYEQDEDHNLTAAIIVCYLPTGTDLLTYWDYFPKLTHDVKYVTGPDGWLVPWTQDDTSPVDCALY